MKKITLIIVLFCVGFINAQEDNYTIKNIGTNTKYHDFGTFAYGNNQVVFASSRKNKSIRKKVWAGNKQPFLELYVGEISNDGEIREVKRFSKKINSKFHDANLVFTKDLKTIYFTSNNYLDKKFKKDSTGWNLNQLYKAEVNDEGKWENVQAMPFNNDHYQTGHPVLNAAEDKLYFISDMPGTLGKTDIFVVDIHKDGTYGTPMNLGPNVNTAGKEMFPFVDENNVLYFSSNGHLGGFGGLDLYAVQLMNETPIRKAENLGLPMNSYKDDFALIFLENKNTGYFSSNRTGGKGDDDIYYFKVKNRIDLDCSQLVSGVVRESGSGAILSNAMVNLYNKSNELVESVKSNDFGEFKFHVNCDKQYKIVASKKNYNEDFEDFETSNIHELEHTMGLTLAPDEFVTIRGMLMININPIYFDLDKSDIRPDAAIEIEKVVRIMKKYPELKVDLGSHTDSRAPDKYNFDLSNRRASSTINWIVKRGIDSSRITGKGFGETQLVNKCSNGVKCTDAEHQLNRRSEFVIVNPEKIK